MKIEEYLCGLRIKQNVTPVIIFDDAHEMRPEAIRILRLLTNFEMDSKLFVSFILCGHLSLRKLLQQADLEDVAQRISHARLPFIGRRIHEIYCTPLFCCRGIKSAV